MPYHLIDRRQVEAEFLGKRHGFAGRNDVHARQELVHHLEGSADTGRITNS